MWVDLSHFGIFVPFFFPPLFDSFLPLVALDISYHANSFVSIKLAM